MAFDKARYQTLRDAGVTRWAAMVMAEDGFADTALAINAQTGTSYTLALTDAGLYVTMTNAGASTLTVPPNASVAFPVGSVIKGAQLGAGLVTLTPGAAVTINASPGLKLGQYCQFELIKYATNTWLATGKLSA